MMGGYQLGIWYFVLDPLASLYTTRIPSAETVSFSKQEYWDIMYTMSDSMGIGSTVLSLVALICLHFSTRLTHMLTSCFPRKVQFSKNRDLLFITTIGPSGADVESTIEVANLEHVPPAFMSDRGWSANNANGFMVMKCLKTEEYFFCSSLLFYCFCDFEI